MRVAAIGLTILTTTAPQALAGTTLDLLEIFDDNRNGVLEGGELDRAETLVREAKAAAAARRAAIAERKANQYKDTLWRTGFLVRDAYQTGAFLDESYEVGEGGARFTFSNDFMNNRAVFTASGSVMYGAFGEVNRQSNPTYLGFLGGIAFDTRWTGSGQRGWLSAAAGFEAARPVGDTFHYFRTDLVYTTDLEANASLLGAETRWVPFIPQLLLGSTSYIGPEDQIGIMFRPALALDYSYVSRNGQFGDLAMGRSYLWGGVKAQLDVFFTTESLKNLSFTAKYMYMHEFFSLGRDSIHFLEAKMRYRINAATFVEAVYTYGNEPRTLSYRNDFLIGLTVQLGDLSTRQE